jgi:hypothetical protein
VQVEELAGAALLAEISLTKSVDYTEIGTWRGMKLSITYDTLNNKHKVVLTGSLHHLGELGTDAVGNITRLYNMLDNLPEHLKNETTKLENYKQELARAQIEVKKTFPQEEELNEKIARLVLVDTQLDLDAKKQAEELAESDKEDEIADVDNNEFDEEEPDEDDIDTDDEEPEVSAKQKRKNDIGH